MKFTVSSRELLRVLKNVGSVILKKNMLPILSNHLFTQTEERFFVTGSSAENALTMPIDIKLNAGDTFTPFCLDASQIISLLSALPEQPITVEVTLTNHQACIFYQGGQVTVPVEETDLYPRVVEMTTPTVQFSIPTSILLPATKAASNNTEPSELRPVLGAVALDITEEGVTFVGTNGYRLYKYVYTHGVPFLTAGGKDIILIPGTIISALAAPFSAAEEVTVTHDGKHVCIQADGIAFTVRDIEAKYPKYEAVLPKNNPYHIILPVAALKAAVRRVQLMANNASQLVKLAKDDMSLRLSTDDRDFSRSACEKLALADVPDACTLPSGFAIGFKSSSLITLLDAISTDNVRIELSAPSRPILIKEDVPNSALTELLMPMKLEE